MSLTARFLQISPEQLQILINDPSLVESFIYPDEEEDTEEDTEDLDKAWDGIHYLLTGDRWTDEIPKREIPLANVIAGGVEIGDDLDHGPARYMTADQVLAVAEALRDLSRDDLAKRFDVAAFHENGIYPPDMGPRRGSRLPSQLVRQPSQVLFERSSEGERDAEVSLLAAGSA